MTAALLVITVYTAPPGTPLYCDTGVGLTYDPAATWIAWDFAVHGGQCDDWIEVVSDGITRRFRALDSGRFGKYCVIQPDGECLPIMADLPAHLAWFEGMSVTVDSVKNWTRWALVAAERMGLTP